MSPRGSQPDHGFFSKEDKHDSDSEGEIISNQEPEGGTSTMEVVKWPDKVEGSGYNTDENL